MKATVPAAVVGDTVAVSVTLAPYDAVVIGVFGVAVSPTASVVVVVVVACDTVTVVGLEVLLVKLADDVGVKTAVRESAPSGSAVVARVAFPLVTVAEVPT